MGGLAASWLLGADHDVTVYEQKESLGLGHLGHRIGDAKGHRIDIPPRVINTTHYRKLFELIGEIKLDTYQIRQQPSFSYLSGQTYLAFQTLVGPGTTISFPKLSPMNAKWMYRHGRELLRWFQFTRSISDSLIDDASTNGSTSLSSYLRSKGFSEPFIKGFLFPMWSLMCTCDYARVDQFPIGPMILLFRDFTGKAATRRIRGGSEAFEQKILARIKTCFLGTEVKKLVRADNGTLSIHTKDGAAAYDHVILATEPSFAAKLSENVCEDESRLVGQVPTYETEMVMHTDARLMPRNKSTWAPVNLFWNATSQSSCATLWMNRIEPDALDENLFQSWDPIIHPDPEKVIARRTFRRSLATNDSQKAIRSLRLHMQEKQDRNLWFVGSYVTDGIPLLENGVHSARLVAQWINR